MNNIKNDDKQTIYCIGNNLATLIGAYEINKAGYSVKLFTDGGFLGGFFSGINIDGRDFDLGMLLLEKFDSISKISKNKSTINSWLTDGKEISSWLDDHVDLRRAATPEAYIFGKKFPDYIMSNRLDLLEKSNIKEPNLLNCDSPYHASNKETGKLFDELSYFEASKYNHGEDFHALYIEPFIRKITSYDSNKFLARYHRFSWAPLYYPETLKLAINGQETGLGEYPFWTTTTGFVGELVKNLKNSISRMSDIQIIEKKITSIDFSKNCLKIDNDLYKTDHKVLLGLGMNRMHELLKSDLKLDGDGVDFTIGLALVHRNAIRQDNGCTFIIDDEFASYRVTDQDAIAGLNPEWHRVSIEANTNILKKKYNNLSPDKSIENELLSFMNIQSDQFIKILKVINVKNGLYLPNKEFIRHKQYLSDRVSSLTMNSAILTGDLLNYGASSINNQIMQGLNFKEQLK